MLVPNDKAAVWKRFEGSLCASFFVYWRKSALLRAVVGKQKDAPFEPARERQLALVVFVPGLMRNVRHQAILSLVVTAKHFSRQIAAIFRLLTLRALWERGMALRVY